MNDYLFVAEYRLPPGVYMEGAVGSGRSYTDPKEFRFQASSDDEAKREAQEFKEQFKDRRLLTEILYRIIK